jgi:hypothetical protein
VSWEGDDTSPLLSPSPFQNLESTLPSPVDSQIDPSESRRISPPRKDSGTGLGKERSGSARSLTFLQEKSPEISSEKPIDTKNRKRSLSLDLLKKEERNSSSTTMPVRRRKSMESGSVEFVESSDPALSNDMKSISPDLKSNLQEKASIETHSELLLSSKKKIISSSEGPTLGLIDIARDEATFETDSITSHHSHIVHNKYPIEQPLADVLDSVRTMDEEDAEEDQDSMMELEARQDSPDTKGHHRCLSDPVTLSTNPVECFCLPEHAASRPILDHTFSTSVEHLWSLVFGAPLQSTDFIRQMWDKMGYKDIKTTKWEVEGVEVKNADLDHDEGPLALSALQAGFQKKLEYTVPSSNSLGKFLINLRLKNPTHVKIL